MRASLNRADLCSEKSFPQFGAASGRCEAQHLGFEPVTSHLSALDEGPSASRSTGGSAWTDTARILHFLFRLQPALPQEQSYLVSGDRDSRAAISVRTSHL